MVARFMSQVTARSGSVSRAAIHIVTARGRFTAFKDPEPVQRDSISALFIDSQNRLWIADNKTGVVRIDNPLSEEASQIRYGTTEGLSSDNARCIGEDQWGRIYVGTVRGVDCINTATGRIKNLSSADGLSSDFRIDYVTLERTRGYLLTSVLVRTS
jgi:ligand-binding sensor domain-containing protein